ncbi:histone H3.3-like [Belonocnema kinseyi]|uniref:histone H3.3-like n=1 Tax=Belonocnema kinseyi TaxID=2817044 RepID=UPI00143D0BDF|nr:histone H3.3-like [Belonocnema kinseyi]
MVHHKSQPRSVRSYSTTSSSTSSRQPGTDNSNRAEVIVDRRRKKRRKSRALQEIKFFRRTTKLLIPKVPFVRLVREIIYDLFPRLGIKRIQVPALGALQEAAEMYIVQFFEDAILLAFHAKRVTLMQRDMVMLRRLRGRDDVINR